MQTRKAIHSDIPGVLALQELNLASNLSAKERENGFVTTPFTIAQIEQVIKENGLFIIEDLNKIVAYVFAGTWTYFSQWEIFNFMVSRFPILNFKDKEITTLNTFQYGPICIEESYRGQGLINLIFEEMRINWVGSFPISITFINKVNTRSTKAHIGKLGWEVIDEFEFKGQTYLGLAIDMNRSVLDV